MCVDHCVFESLYVDHCVFGSLCVWFVGLGLLECTACLFGQL